MNVVYDAGVYRVADRKEFCEFLTHYVFKGGSCIIISYVESFFGSSGFRVGETDRGTPLGEAAVTVQAHAGSCPARVGGGDGRHTEV